MELPKRKPNRLKGHDYSSPGAYFLTICTANRKNLFWQNVGATIGRPQDVILTPHGTIVEQAIQKIAETYAAVSVDCYAIMPNHVHLLLQIHADKYGRPMVAPTTDIIIRQMKGFVSKKIGRSIWQKLYHDRIVRNQKEYDKIAAYIYNNPLNWQRDCFYNQNT